MQSAGHFDEKTLTQLAANQDWQELLRITEELTPEQSAWDLSWYFRGLALLRVARLNEATLAIDQGLSISPAAEWGNQLAFEAYLAKGQIRYAFDRFEEFILAGPNHEQQKAYYVERAAELGLFDLATAMNERRSVLNASRKSPKYALALQCFAKPDTLELVFTNLLRLQNSKEFGLVIAIDRFTSSCAANYKDGNHDVRKLIGQNTIQLLDQFFSVQIMQNDENLGTAPTCRRLLDYVARNYQGFLFIEDDCLLAPGALNWANHHLGNSISFFGSWFVTCESMFLIGNLVKLLKKI